MWRRESVNDETIEFMYDLLSLFFFYSSTSFSPSSFIVHSPHDSQLFLLAIKASCSLPSFLCFPLLQIKIQKNNQKNQFRKKSKGAIAELL